MASAARGRCRPCAPPCSAHTARPVEDHSRSPSVESGPPSRTSRMPRPGRSATAMTTGRALVAPRVGRLQQPIDTCRTRPASVRTSTGCAGTSTCSGTPRDAARAPRLCGVRGDASEIARHELQSRRLPTGQCRRSSTAGQMLALRQHVLPARCAPASRSPRRPTPRHSLHRPSTGCAARGRRSEKRTCRFSLVVQGCGETLRATGRRDLVGGVGGARTVRSPRTTGGRPPRPPVGVDPTGGRAGCRPECREQPGDQRHPEPAEPRCARSANPTREQHKCRRGRPPIGLSQHQSACPQHALAHCLAPCHLRDDVVGQPGLVGLPVESRPPRRLDRGERLDDCRVRCAPGPLPAVRARSRARVGGARISMAWQRSGPLFGQPLPPSELADPDASPATRHGGDHHGDDRHQPGDETARPVRLPCRFGVRGGVAVMRSPRRVADAGTCG